MKFLRATAYFVEDADIKPPDGCDFPTKEQLDELKLTIDPEDVGTEDGAFVGYVKLANPSSPVFGTFSTLGQLAAEHDYSYRSGWERSESEQFMVRIIGEYRPVTAPETITVTKDVLCWHEPSIEHCASICAHPHADSD